MGISIAKYPNLSENNLLDHDAAEIDFYDLIFVKRVFIVSFQELGFVDVHAHLFSHERIVLLLSEFVWQFKILFDFFISRLLKIRLKCDFGTW